MHVVFLNSKGTWRDIADSARTTIGLDPKSGEVPPSWRRRMLLCEHSPIRQLLLKWKWVDLKSWVSVHFVRHHEGIQHWVKTARTDRTGYEGSRDDLSQGNLVIHECEANAQAIINISRKRLCRQASPETREAWRAFLESFKYIEPELYRVCVPECVYRNGLCPEYRTCGYSLTDEFKGELNEYLGDMYGRTIQSQYSEIIH